MSQKSKKKGRENASYPPTEDLYRALFEQAGDGIFIANTEGRYIEINQRGCQMLGYTREELLDLSIKDLIPTEDLARDPLPLDELRTGSPLLKERRLRCKDGRLLSVEISAQMLSDGRFLGMVRDITERKRAEGQLRESNERFRLLAESSLTGIYLIQENQFRYVNPALAHIFGYEVEEVIDKLGPMDLVYPDDRPLVAKNIRRRIEGETDAIHYDFRGLCKDGSMIYVDVHGRRIEYSGKTGVIGTLVDITERKQVEDELRQNREAALQFSEQLAVLQDVTNHLSKAESTDDLCLQAVQWGHSRLEFDRISIWFIEEDQNFMQGSFGTDERGQVRDERNANIKFRRAGLAWQVFSQKEANALIEHHSLYNHEGQVVGEGDNAIAALWDGDEVIGVVSVDNLFTHRPITERQLEVLRLYATTLGHLITRKRAEEALRASEERYRALYRDNPSMFFTLDNDGMVVSVNAFGASQLGYTIEELEGQSILQVFYEDDQTAVKTQLQRCIQTPEQISQWEFRKVRKDGSLLWVEEFARAVTDPNGATNVLIVCQDITDRRQAEIEQKRLLAKIQEQAQQVQNIIDTVPEGVILLSQDQVVTLTNPLAGQYLTLLEPELQNGRLTHLGNRLLNELLTSPPKGLWHEITSGVLVFEAITRPVENSPDNGGWVLVLRDITQERIIQQRVQRQERLAAVGQLAAGIAHDFNNILAVILLYTQFISRTASMPTSTKEQLHTIEQQAQRAKALIQQILDFSRQSVLERQPLDLLPFMEKIVTLLERTLPEHIQVEFECAAETCFIHADPTRMQQVIMNLAVNARDAMPEGGRLNIRLAHVQTEVPQPMPIQDLPPGHWIQIAVADSGNGIPPEMLSNIFEPFFTTKMEGQGTGLGLAQVYGIVQQHEGFVDVATEVGQGTTFSLYFPALNMSERVADPTDTAVLQLGQGQRVLVVEDAPDTRKALKDSLALLNYDVVEATNGREALAILATEVDEIDLVLSDTVMPEMGGIALYHTMREQKLTIPVVLLTGHPLSKEMENLQTLGLAGWLPKPIDLVTLSYLLADVLKIEI